MATTATTPTHGMDALQEIEALVAHGGRWAGTDMPLVACWLRSEARFRHAGRALAWACWRCRRRRPMAI